MVIVISASTDSNVNRSRLLGYDFAPAASFTLVRKAVEAAERKIILSCRFLFLLWFFYHPVAGLVDQMEKMNILCIEMEAAGLFGVAAEYGANALAILTISDHIRTGEAMNSKKDNLV